MEPLLSQSAVEKNALKSFAEPGSIPLLMLVPLLLFLWMSCSYFQRPEHSLRSKLPYRSRVGRYHLFLSGGGKSFSGTWWSRSWSYPQRLCEPFELEVLRSILLSQMNSWRRDGFLSLFLSISRTSGLSPFLVSVGSLQGGERFVWLTTRTTRTCSFFERRSLSI